MFGCRTRIARLRAETGPTKETVVVRGKAFWSRGVEEKDRAKNGVRNRKTDGRRGDEGAADFRYYSGFDLYHKHWCRFYFLLDFGRPAAGILSSGRRYCFVQAVFHDDDDGGGGGVLGRGPVVRHFRSARQSVDFPAQEKKNKKKTRTITYRAVSYCRNDGDTTHPAGNRTRPDARLDLLKVVIQLL